ncbi:MAG: NAD(P)/FAD-dependent oxidoreductase [Burkholderiaceae bacterium]
MSERCDVLIVGGGPAGSTCARLLAAAGIDVLVLDRKPFPRDKVCAGWVTPAVMEELAIDPAAYQARGHTLAPITGFITGMIGQAPVETRYAAPVSYGIRRCEFDAFLLARSGARIAPPAPLKSLERSAAGWLANSTIFARVVVGAGGHFCPVARQINEEPAGGEPVVAAQEIEFEMSPEQAAACGAQGHTPELYFCPDLKGYGWVFRKDNYLNIGLGREDKTQLGEHVELFLDWLKLRGRVPFDIPNQLHGHAYLLYQHAPRELVANRVLLIGDAAGLAYAQSGEGIRPAVESAMLAAETLIAARGDYASVRLAPYALKMVERFGPRHTVSISEHLPAGLKRMLAARLLGSSWFTRHVVLDQCFLHARQSALAR